MRKYYTILVALLLVLSHNVLLGQHKKMKKAAIHLEALQYEEAIKIYKKVIRKKGLVQAKLELANTYLQVQDYQQSAHWYADAMAQESVAPIHYLKYGYALLYGGDCLKADSLFQQYLQMTPFDPRQKKLADICTYWTKIHEENGPWTEMQEVAFNSTSSDLSPTFYNDRLVFSSLRTKGKGDRLLFGMFSIPYTQEGKNISWGDVEIFNEVPISKETQAIGRISPNQEHLFLTRNQKSKESDQIVRLEIISAEQAAPGLWTELSPFPFNDDTYSVAHPTLSKDGSLLFFSSDMPGGFGGKDLYVTIKNQDGSWSEPMNLGQPINTEGNELYPFIAEDDILYFSSDGHPGMGGQDVFVASYGEETGWVNIQNLGAPINSAKDDFDFILHPQKNWGVVVSNRNQAQGDNLFVFQGEQPVLEEKTIHFIAKNKYSNEILTGVKWSNDCDKVDEKFDINTQVIYLNEDECCTLVGRKDNFNLQLTEVCAIDYATTDTVFISLTQHTTTISGILADAEGKAKTYTEIELIKDGEVLDETYLTEGDGSFNITVKEQGCYQIKVVQDGYAEKLTEAYCIDKTMQAQEIGSIALQKEEATQAGPAQQEFDENTVLTEVASNVEFLINVYYDVGRSGVQKSSLTELNRLYEVLKTNKDVIVEISSHTDSQGRSDSNLRLSQKRANVIVKYLVGRGISSSRLLPKGYGETSPVNKCVDGVECTEAELQENRRTTFKVLGLITAGR